MLTKQLREMERQASVVTTKKEITFKDSWLTEVSNIVKKYEHYTHKGWTTLQKYDDLVKQKIIKPIK